MKRCRRELTIGLSLKITKLRSTPVLPSYLKQELFFTMWTTFKKFKFHLGSTNGEGVYQSEALAVFSYFWFQFNFNDRYFKNYCVYSVEWWQLVLTAQSFGQILFLVWNANSALTEKLLKQYCLYLWSYPTGYSLLRATGELEAPSRLVLPGMVLGEVTFERFHWKSNENHYSSLLEWNIDGWFGQ